MAMTIQDDRLKIVEFDLKQFKTETMRAYQDMAFEMTMTKGLTEDAIKRLSMLREQINQRFDRLEGKSDEHTILLTEILERLPSNT